MPESRHDRLARLFAAAAELDGAARADWLRRECAGDDALRAEIEALLAADADAAFLGDAPAPLPWQRLAETAPPTRIGAFTLREVLGRGGMGVVYRATQDNPAREVALKVLAPHMATASGRRRFAAETEALGRLQHPGIAQIHEAGTYQSPWGEQPWLAMELVHGEPLDAWAARHRHEQARCLRLWIALCEAIHHAHQKGVIHRDLKPGNVLVDERDQPKVLDFGIARLVADEAAGSLHTQAGQVLGTLAWMSPEQARGDRDCIDIRTDVYSLGAIGYQLLCGRPPLDLQHTTLAAGLRLLLDHDAAPLGSLDPRLRGDLETICATALQRDPERRYASAQALGDDLRRHLARAPILARPATRIYLFACFARRHAFLLTGMALLFVGLATALFISLQATARVELARQREQQARTQAEGNERAAQRQMRAKAATLAFVEQVFIASDPARNPSARQLTFAQRLTTALESMESSLREDPDNEVAVRAAVARTLDGLGEAHLAMTVLDPLLPRLRDLEPGTAIDIALDHATAAWRADEFDDALAALDTASALVSPALPRVRGIDPVLAYGLQIANLRAQVLQRQGHAQLAEAELRTGLALAAGTDHAALRPLTAAMRGSLGALLLERHDTATALDLIDEALAVLDEDPSPTAANVLVSLNTKATVAFARGELAEAVRVFTRIHASWLRIFGPDHPTLVDLLQNLAAARARLGEVEPAIDQLQEAIALGERLRGTDDPLLVGPLANLGFLRWQQRDLAAAAAHYERAIAIRLARSPGADRQLSGYWYDLARIRRDQGDAATYLALLERSLAVRIEALGPFHELVLTRRVELATALDRQGRRRDAIDELRRIDAKLPEVLGRRHKATIQSARLLAQLALDLGELDQVPGHLQALRERAAGAADESELQAAAAAIQRALDAAR